MNEKAKKYKKKLLFRWTIDDFENFGHFYWRF